MAHRLDGPNRYGGTTDHSEEIAELRALGAEALHDNDKGGDDELVDNRMSYLMFNLAADLLEAHDQTGISLDDWPYARQFVEKLIEAPVLPNGV